jgi:hypothetical protein
MTCRKPSRCVADLETKGFDVAVRHVGSSNRGESKLARKLSRVVVHKSQPKKRKLS